MKNDLEANMRKFIKRLEELKEATKDVMPLVSKSLALTVEIAETYQEAMKELLKDGKK